MGGGMTCIIKGEAQVTNSRWMGLSIHLRDSSLAERTAASVGGAAHTRILAPERMQGRIRCGHYLSSRNAHNASCSASGI